MDLSDHLKKLESFTRKVGPVRAGSRPAAEVDPSLTRDELWERDVERAVVFLRQAGARPNIVEVRQGVTGPLIGFRLESFDPRGLIRHLQSLGSARAVAEWVEQGVEAGAVAVRGDRIFLVVESGRGRGVTPLGSGMERGLDATSAVVQVAQEHIRTEVEPTLNLLEGARASGGGQVVQFKGDLPPESRQLMGDDEPPAGLMDRLRRLVQKPTPLIKAEELGADPRFVVVGPAVDLPGGKFYPVEAVDPSTRQATSRARQKKPSDRMWLRTEDAEELRGVDRGPGPEAELEGEAPDKKRARQIQSAYRLLHGITLAPGEGQPLEAGVAARMESFFGTNFGDVKIHSGRIAAEIVDALSVDALSMGSHVVIPERLLSRPDGAGERLLVHELTHVRQARRNPDVNRSVKEFEADRAVQEFTSNRLGSPVMRATPPTRAPAAPASSRGVMPAKVYASAKSAVVNPDPHPDHPRGIGLRTEDKIRRITNAIQQRNRQSEEDVIDREG